MTYDFNGLKEQLRNVDIGRQIQIYNSNSLPNSNDISLNKMAWVKTTVLYCDISGYTSLTNNTRKETVARILSAFFWTMVKLTNDSNGIVTGFAGDRIMSAFSFPTITESIDNAIACALRMQSTVRYILPKEFEERNFPIESLSCSIGIDYGPVLMGKYGSQKSKGLTLVGDAANISAKLQAQTDSNTTMVTDVVYKNFPNWITKSKWSSSQLRIKGLRDIMTVWSSGSYYSYE